MPGVGDIKSNAAILQGRTLEHSLRDVLGRDSHQSISNPRLGCQLTTKRSANYCSRAARWGTSTSLTKCCKESANLSIRASWFCGKPHLGPAKSSCKTRQDGLAASLPGKEPPSLRSSRRLRGPLWLHKDEQAV